MILPFTPIWTARRRKWSDLAAAKAVLTNRVVTQTEIDAAVESLGGEIAALVALNAPLYDGTDLTDKLTKTSTYNQFAAPVFHYEDPVDSDSYNNVVYAPAKSSENNVGTAFSAFDYDSCYYRVFMPKNTVLVYTGTGETPKVRKRDGRQQTASG